jgi:hypothetical protein
MTKLASDTSLKAKKYLFFCILVVNALVITCVICFLPVRFEENDDICMLLISSGGYSGTPDAHLVFINYVYGLSLKLLYELWKGVEWYTLSFVVLHVLSITVILFSVIKDVERRVVQVLFVAVFYSIELQILLHLQFTTTAAVVCLAGISLLQEQQFSRRVLGVLLCVIGSLLRLEISLIVLFISFPLVIREILEHKTFRIPVPLVYWGIAVALIGTLEVVDQASYGEEDGWKAYVEYNKVRGQINDNPKAVALAEKLPRSIQPIDYALLLRFFQDGTVLNTRQLTVIASKMKSSYFTNKLSEWPPSLFLYKKYLLLVGFLFLLAITSVGIQADRLVLILTTSLFLVAVYGVAITVSLKYRIFISVLLPLLYSICKSVKKNRVNLYAKMLPGSLFLLFLYSADYVYQFIGQNTYLKTRVLEQHAFIADYLAHSSNVLVPYAADYRTEGTPVFHVSDMHFKQRLFFGGWFTNIPLNAGRYTSHQDFAKKHSLFLRQESRGILPLLIESIYLNYGVRVKPVVVAESVNDIIVEFTAI